METTYQFKRLTLADAATIATPHQRFTYNGKVFEFLALIKDANVIGGANYVVVCYDCNSRLYRCILVNQNANEIVYLMKRQNNK